MPVVLQVAVSLDGRIARGDGAVDWLPAPDDAAEQASDERWSWADFWGSVRAIVMGRASYEMVHQSGGWHHDEVPTWVYTSRELDPPPPHPAIHTTSASPQDLVTEIRESLQDGEDGIIWLFGGGHVVAQFEEAACIDRWELAVMPTLLGEGIPLWPRELPQRDLRLVGSEAQPGGWIMLVYERAERDAPAES